MAKYVHTVKGTSRTAWGAWEPDSRDIYLIGEDDVGKSINNYHGTNKSKEIEAKHVGTWYEVYYSSLNQNYEPNNGAKISSALLDDPKWHEKSNGWSNVIYYNREGKTNE